MAFELANAILMAPYDNINEKHRVMLHVFKDYEHSTNEIKTLCEQSALSLLSKTGDAKLGDTLMDYGIALFLPCSELIKTISEQKNLDDTLKTQFINKVHLLTARELLLPLRASPFKEVFEKAYNSSQIVTHESLVWSSVAQELKEAQSSNAHIDLEQIDIKGRQEQYQEIVSNVLHFNAPNNNNQSPLSLSFASARFFDSPKEQGDAMYEKERLYNKNL